MAGKKNVHRHQQLPLTSEVHASAWRKSSQALLPQQLIDENEKEGYRIYPFHALGPGKIFTGYHSLADWISRHRMIIIDGYNGVFWSEIQAALDKELTKKGLRVKWFKAEDQLKSSAEINELVKPFLGTPGSVWGKKCTLAIEDFFITDQLQALAPDEACDINILIGTAAALAGWEAPLLYFDLPKNEQQYRMRAGTALNFGHNCPEESSAMYKRAYFVDWVVLNAHKENILSRVAVVADAQRKDGINWMPAQNLREGLRQMSTTVFRVRPWFEPGAWGGQWIKERIEGLNKEVVNYAWSFELIVPENGLIFESDGHLLEVSFDFLMFQEYEAVLGRHAERFKTEFPIRFDFLDTWKGGNLSIQCHPSLPYIRENFGENITQDETYYILDCRQDAQVYLGFQEDIAPEVFREELEASAAQGKEVDIDRYVRAYPARQHELYLIPNGTIHSAGAGNLVLEISATPYIFTFKMYDWLRLDLEGKPRPINIEHAFNNLDFERKGDQGKKELISRPYTIQQGADWELVHLPTHPEHFYDVHRIEFDSVVHVSTENTCHILMLVEGTAVAVEMADGSLVKFNYAETFVVPAAAQRYSLRRLGSGSAKVVKAFVKADII